MLIDLKTISQEVQRYAVVLEGTWWHPDIDSDRVMESRGPLKAEMEIYRAGKKYVLQGTLDGGLLLRCDRCLKPYFRDFQFDFRVFLTVPPQDRDPVDVELQEEDMETEFIQGDELNVDEVIKEQIYLSLPIRSLCSAKCDGLCPVCGCDLNQKICQCRREQGHPGFSIFKNVKIEGEHT